MVHALLISRLAAQLRIKRLNRGLTQTQLADLAIEKGTHSVCMNVYARIIAALDCELTVVPAVMPTLEALAEIFV
ncbi:transcriptional regulator [Pseudomonas sp. 13B_3.2_Bac1]|uniref:transcriptional regulator n=1 Tax=Pseudomonas sp. 13B_3.2_Bac1 TaxID=2971623 RepID=UPI0021C63B85|nr:transcriptional regulator [Pseudomonas sp. 13B_3.2_Bac1]MCU1773014.1 transcriptional regulator [Pseudomonas sp. 13B_3.2_Bac1]